MAFDGIVTRAVVSELQKLIGARIYKIHQPHSSDIVMTIRGQGGNSKLLLSANPTYPRMHLTTEEFVNPQEAPMFCMLLRKHCEGGVIERIEQVDMERIVHIDVKSRDELGDVTAKRIIIEIMGRHSNIILLDTASNTILDSAHHVSHGVSQYRQVLPGRQFVAPPSQNKKNLLNATEGSFVGELNWNAGKVDKQLVDTYSGLSPLIAREILHRAKLPTREAIWREFDRFIRQVREGDYQPQIADTKDKSFFYIGELTHLDGTKVTHYPSVSEMLQHFFQDKAMRDVVKQRVHDLIRIVTNEKNKNEKKIEKLEETISEAVDAERFRIYGELITANMHQLQKGQTELTTENWYDENGGTITIPLDPLKTPSENLQAYYKKYNKAKNSIQVVEEQIQLAKEEFAYLDGILVQLSDASLTEAEEIRDELVEQGYLRDRRKRGMKKKKDTRPELDTYYSSEGVQLLVGKNNKQNEYLTNKLALGFETWLHTKDIPGSHVVIRSREFSEETLLEAANLAAYFSKARSSGQVPVDYTLVKHVKKPNGSKPGFVIYDNQRTLYITPDESLIERLRTNQPAKQDA
ncbi:Rqc2 family fibronectin-binding protein [Brevibacillus dissolubilis]|uniref:Rqc2 family fibronectin-binding protein n=1 Tax=Brevibacillus dissolubilis TaxID=1844116 RepID=UPI0011168DD7|nr:NFACT RNA binding domain-containing protein [Brevibacillus dissolubilis]